MIQKKNKKKLKTHVSYSVTFFFLENLAFFLDNVKKYFIAGQATYDNMEHAHCMLDTQDCRHTLRICNNYCFPTATVVA
jgi:hypothetical protein